MALELGDVIAQIGGAGGGVDAVPRRYVYDFNNTPIPVTVAADEVIMHEVPDVPEGATVVVTLYWAASYMNGEPAVVLAHAFDTFATIGDASDSFGLGVLPMTILATPSMSRKDEERGMFMIAGSAEGCTAIRLEAIIIPAIK